MSSYETWLDFSQKGRVSSDRVADILQIEINRLLDGTDRYILQDGFIYEDDYRHNIDDKVREATSEEIDLYEALLKTKIYFKSLK